MPDFDFDAFNHDTPYEGDDSMVNTENTGVESPVESASTEVNTTEMEDTSFDNGASEEVDKW
jgi:hypothetical protein